MSDFEVTIQLVDSPTDESRSAGRIPADGLIDAFRSFPFESEVQRGLALPNGATFPTINFRRASDDEEIAVWTDDAKRFDLCFVREGRKRFLNNQSKEAVETILQRFMSESVADIQPRSILQRLFGR